MKIEEQKEVVLSNISVGSGVKAKLANSSIIAELLRKHYSNVKRTMIQEYISNARDAHRESGCPMKELEVSLPSLRNPFLEIRDFGNTMTEERLFSNFINYGDSTKRNSNLETGGFGLGSKIGYAYTPTFYLVLYKDGFESLYQASTVDEALGELKLLSKKLSNKDRGFSVKIPIDPDDFDYICRSFYDITYYWQEPIRVANLSEDEIDVSWKNKNLLRTDNYVWDLNNTECEKKSIILVDGIPYNASSMANTIGIMSFKTGEIVVSINREQFVHCAENSNAISISREGYDIQEHVFLDYIISSIQDKTLEEKAQMKSKLFSYYKLCLDVKSEKVMLLSSFNTVTGLTSTRSDEMLSLFFDFTDIKYNVFHNKKNKTNYNYRCWEDTLTSTSAKDYTLFTATTLSYPTRQITQSSYPSNISKFIVFRSEFDLLKKYESYTSIMGLKEHFAQIEAKAKAEAEIYKARREAEQEANKKQNAEREAAYAIRLAQEKAEQERQAAREMNAKDCTKKILDTSWDFCNSSYYGDFANLYYITESEYRALTSEEHVQFFIYSIMKSKIYKVNDLAQPALIDSGAKSYRVLLEENKEFLNALISDYIVYTALKEVTYKSRKAANKTSKTEALLKANLKNITDVLNFKEKIYSSVLTKLNTHLDAQFTEVRNDMVARLDKNQGLNDIISFGVDSWALDSMLEYYVFQEVEKMYKKEQ